MITQGYLKRLAKIESSDNPLAQNPKSSAKGRYQFIDSTAKQYGITAEFGTPEYEAQENDAILRFTTDNYKHLESKLGRKPTNGELYLAHQQGAGGAVRLLSDPDARAVDVLGEDQVKLNGGNADMTLAEFGSTWTGKFADLDADQHTIQAPESAKLLPQDILSELKNRGVDLAASGIDEAQGQKKNQSGFGQDDLYAELQARGLTHTLRSIDTEKNVEPEGERNFPQRIYDIALDRESKIQAAGAMAEQHNKPYAKILPMLGQAAAFVGDVAFETVATGAKMVSPEFVEAVGDGVEATVAAVANTTPAKYLSQEYGQFKETHPLLAENIEGGLETSLFFLPVARAGGKATTATKGLATSAEELADNLAASGTRPAVQIDTTRRALKRILKRSDADHSELLATLRESDTLTIADIAGDEVQGLTRSLGKMEGAKNEIHGALTGRSEAAVERVSKVLSERISTIETYFGQIEDIASSRRAVAKPLYKKAFTQGQNITDERLNKFLQDKRVSDAIIKAKEKYGVPLEVAPNSLEALDGAKKVIYDLESAARNAGESNLAAAYKELRHGFVSVLDENVPAYKDARKVYEDSSRLIDAQKMGRDFTKLRPEQIKKQVEGMEPHELDAYRIGVREKLQETVSKTSDGRDPAKRIFGNTEKRAQLKEVFPDSENFSEFSKRMIDEIKGFNTQQAILGGSRSDYNIASDIGFIDAAADGVRRGIVDASVTKIWEVTTEAIKRTYMGINNKNAGDLAKILVDRDAGIEALQKLLEKQDDMVQRAAVNQAIKNHAPMTMID